MINQSPVRLLALAALAFAAATPASGQYVESRRFGITSFDRVDVQGDMIVEITPSSSISAVAQGSSDALDTLDMQVRERTLYIHQAYEGSYGPRRQATGPVTIRLTAQNLAAVTLSGSGAVRATGLRGSSLLIFLDGAGTIDAAISTGTDVSARSVGSGTVTLSGQARTLNALTRGAAAIDASALPVRDLTVQAVGSGASHFAASATATISAIGSVNITVAGRPTCTVRNSGAGTIACGDNARNRLPQSVDQERR